MVSQYVKVLTENIGVEAENHLATDSYQARTILKGGHYDVLHLHGCWRNSSRAIVAQALRQGTRLVVTPHGQLEPWIQDQRRWKEKLPKRLLYQRSIIRQAYAVVIQGRMEQECMEQLGWNPRCVIIRNSIVTCSITPQEMAHQTFALYRRIMDSNPWELMTEETRQAAGCILKAGITGDSRWLKQEGVTPIVNQWRELLCFAHQEQILDVVQRGIRILRLDPPDIDVKKIVCFMPDDYTPSETIQSAIGLQYATENERLLATFRHLKKLVTAKKLSIMHLVELDHELRLHSCEEAELADTLRARRLWKLACRLMALMRDKTFLTEGFMPVPPIDDRFMRQMKRQIEERLKIK